MTYWSKAALVPDKATPIWTTDESGRKTGEYIGYWKFEKGTVVLYPAKGSYIYGKTQLPKHEISDRLIRRKNK